MAATGFADRLVRFLGEQAPVSVRAAGTRLLRRSVARAPGTVILLALVTVAEVPASLLIPRALGHVIDAATRHGRLFPALVLLGAVLAVATITDALDGLIAAYYGSGVTAYLRRTVLSQALRLGVPGRRRFPAGDMVTRLTINAESPATFLPMLFSTGATVLTAAGSIAGLALIDLRLAAVFLIGAPVAMPLLRAFLRRAGGPFVRYQEYQAAITTRLLDAHGGAQTIKAAGTVDREVDRILQPLPGLHETGQAIWAAQGRTSWQLSLLVPMMQVLVLGVGGLALHQGAITAGQLVAATAYVGLALGAVGLLDTLVSLLHAQVGAGRVAEVCETTIAPAPAQLSMAARGSGRIDFGRISVSIDGQPILDQLDLSVPAGASVAVVGRSGTGKTTLVSLIGRLADPDAGSVLLDGTPVRLLEPATLGRLVAYAFERPALIGATVHDMIAYAHPGTSRAEVRAAARAAQADRFIERLPDGYDTPLAAAPLSGGERQRLGLARAILTDPRVLVLDDATSSLDTATEMQFTAALDDLRRGRTSITVTYRAATAARADLVAWLDGGQVAALEPHDRLWECASYRALFGSTAVPAQSPPAGQPR